MKGTRADQLPWCRQPRHACLLIAVCITALALPVPAWATASWQATVTGGWTPRLDGNLASFAGEWADATLLTLASKGQPRQYKVWFKHDGRSLWMAWLVEDPTPETWDRAVLLMDTDHDAAASPWPDDRRLEVTRTGQSSLVQGNGQSWASSLPVWESRFLDSSSGWSIEVMVPLSLLGVAMSHSGFMAGQSKTLGMALEYFDLPGSNQTAAGSWPPTTGLNENSPRTWGSLLLQGASVTTYIHTTTVLHLTATQTTDWFTVTQTISRASTTTITTNRTTTIDLATTTTSTRVTTTTILATHSSTSLVREKTTKTVVSTLWTTTSTTSWEVPPWVFIPSLSVAAAITSLAVLRIRRSKIHQGS